jgi:iron complex transport system ATP-binding protein
MSALVEALGVEARLGGRAVLQDVNLGFGPGWTALVGPNGAGKSTLLRVLAGLLPVSAGQVRLQGRALAAHTVRERGLALAWLAQQGEAVGDLTARDIVRLARLPHTGLVGARSASDEVAVQAALAETEAGALAERRLDELSGGERQRVLLARALAVGAPVLLLDEPTTHLDAPHQRALLRGLLQRARSGAAVVSVLHDLSLALAADRVVVLAGGRVRADGPPQCPALRAALEAVFEHAIRIQPVAGGPAAAAPRWVAVPVLPD